MYDFLSTSFTILYCLEIILSGPLSKKPVEKNFELSKIKYEVPPISNGIKDDLPFSQYLVINEIHFDYYPVVALPECEFIEIYNASNDTINTYGLFINGSQMPESFISPEEYVVICKESNLLLFNPDIKKIGIDSWDILNNEGQSIIIRDQNSAIIDQVSYSPDWIQDINKKGGGWSLELINPYAPCRWSDSWKVSVDRSGGTPGRENSIYNTDPDQENPVLEKIFFLDDSTLSITFSEPITIGNINLSESFHFEPFLDFIRKGDWIDFQSSVSLKILQINKGQIYTLSISELSDCSGNSLPDTTVILGIGKQPEFNEILITELMIDETPSIGLPECEYIEILNTSNSIIDLDGIYLTANNDYYDFNNYQLLPGQYYLLVHESNVNLFQDEINIIPMPYFPKLNNSGKRLAFLTAENRLLFSITYDKSWYNDLEKSDGGYSIEMIDFNNPCGDQGNWRASDHSHGGTPGEENSVIESNPDFAGPIIQNVFCKDPVNIEIILNEKLDPFSLNHMIIRVNNSAVEYESLIDSIEYKKIGISLYSPLLFNTVYVLELKNIEDCVGNSIKKNNHTFTLPENAKSQEIIFNEVLSNPKPGGVRWIELYNNSNKYIDLTGWNISISNSNGHEEKVYFSATYILPPLHFLALSDNSEILLADFPLANKSALYDLSSKINLKDEKEVIILRNSDSLIIDQLPTTILRHNLLLKNTEGVALERVSSKKPTSDIENWSSASSESGFGTPGYRNSQDINYQNNNYSITISPEIFSPDSDGYNDIVTIKYEINKPGFLSNIYVYNFAGNRIKTISNGTIIGTQGQVLWDGHYDNGKIALPGYYILLFELINPKGGYEIIKRKVTVGRKL